MQQFKVFKGKKINTIGIEIKLVKKLRKGKILLSYEEVPSTKRLLSTTTRQYIEVLDVNSEPFEVENKYRNTATAISIVSKAIHFIAFKVFYLMLNFSVSLHLHICLSFFTLLRVMSGRYMGLATWLIHSISSTSYFGFFRQDIAPSDQLDQCKLLSDLKQDGLSCSFVDNYLTNIAILGCMVVIGLCIQLYLKKSGKTPSQLWNWGNYSSKWVLFMFYGSTYEITAYIMVNFIYMHNTKLMVAGVVLSCASAAAIFAFSFCLYRAGPRGKANQQESVAFIQISRELPVVTMIRYIKMAGTGILSAALIDTHVAQSLVVLTVELVYLGILVTNRKNWKLESLAVEIVLGSTFCVVLILKAISFANLSDNSIDGLGVAMFIALVLNLLFVLSWSVHSSLRQLTPMQTTRAQTTETNMHIDPLPSQEQMEVEEHPIDGKQIEILQQ